MTAQESNKIKDRIIELLEENEGGQKPLYPLLHFVEAQLSAKEQECDRLTKENEYHRSENHPLRISNAAYASACDGFQKENQELRKRCEDLEAALKGIDSSLYIGPDLNDEEILKFYVNVCGTVKEEIQKLLNQIKS